MTKFLTILIIGLSLTTQLQSIELINKTGKELWLKYQNEMLIIAPENTIFIDPHNINVEPLVIIFKDAPFAQDNYETILHDRNFLRHLSPSISSLKIEAFNEITHSFPVMHAYPGGRIEKTSYALPISNTWYIIAPEDQNDRYALAISPEMAPQA